MAARDPYEVLGLKRDASERDIRAAYRRLAKQHHPDVNRGNRQAEERFKEISAANDLLGDPARRARYDRGEIDAAGQERARRYGPAAAGPGPDEQDVGDIFAELFRRGGPRGARPNARMHGADARYTLEVDFLDAVNGATRRLALPGGKHLDVHVPPGIDDGQVMRLKGQGGPGRNGGEAGDALIEIHVAAHPFYRRDGDDIRYEVPVTLAEAVLGGRITVPTPSGNVSVAVPRHSDSGAMLRLRGKGVPARASRPAGDAYVTLRVVIGEPDPALEEFLRKRPAPSFDPRRDMTGEA